MGNYLVQVFRSLSESIVYEIDNKPPPGAVETCTNFIVRTHGKMQMLYKTAVAVLAIYFASNALLRHRKMLVNIPLKERAKIIKAWQGSRLSIKRDFIKLVSSLSILSYYDSKEVTDRLGMDREAYLRVLSFYNGGSSDD